MVRFTSAQEITLDELRVELIFPADDAAKALFEHVGGDLSDGTGT